jgi:hypothetical protein
VRVAATTAVKPLSAQPCSAKGLYLLGRASCIYDPMLPLLCTRGVHHPLCASPHPPSFSGGETYGL